MNRKPMTRPTSWRLMWWTFAVWAANFFLGYAAALLFPDGIVARTTLVALAVMSLPIYVWLWRRADSTEVAVVQRLAVAIAAMATLYNALPAFF